MRLHSSLKHPQALAICFDKFQHCFTTHTLSCGGNANGTQVAVRVESWKTRKEPEFEVGLERPLRTCLSRTHVAELSHCRSFFLNSHWAWHSLSYRTWAVQEIMRPRNESGASEWLEGEEEETSVLLLVVSQEEHTEAKLHILVQVRSDKWEQRSKNPKSNWLLKNSDKNNGERHDFLTRLLCSPTGHRGEHHLCRGKASKKEREANSFSSCALWGRMSSMKTAGKEESLFLEQHC